MKKLVLVTILTVFALFSATTFAAPHFVIVSPSITGSTVQGNWTSPGIPVVVPFTLYNANNLTMIVHINSLANDPLTGDPLSSFNVSCGTLATPTPVLVLPGDSIVCETNTNVTMTTNADGTDPAAMGTYDIIFQTNPPCKSKCARVIK